MPSPSSLKVHTKMANSCIPDLQGQRCERRRRYISSWTRPTRVIRQEMEAWEEFSNQRSHIPRSSSYMQLVLSYSSRRSPIGVRFTPLTENLLNVDDKDNVEKLLPPSNTKPVGSNAEVSALHTTCLIRTKAKERITAFALGAALDHRNNRKWGGRSGEGKEGRWWLSKQLPACESP